MRYLRRSASARPPNRALCVSQALEISLMRRAVDVVQRQDGDRNRAETATIGTKTMPRLCRMAGSTWPGLRAAESDPREDEPGKEGADASDTFSI